jgi:hypothetical protein
VIRIDRRTDSRSWSPPTEVAEASLAAVAHVARSRRGSAHGSILAGGGFLNVLKLADLDGFFGELGGGFEFSAQGIDEILNCAHVHIGATVEVGYGGSINGESSLARSGYSEDCRGPSTPQGLHFVKSLLR